MLYNASTAVRRQYKRVRCYEILTRNDNRDIPRRPTAYWFMVSWSILGQNREGEEGIYQIDKRTLSVRANSSRMFLYISSFFISFPNDRVFKCFLLQCSEYQGHVSFFVMKLLSPNTFKIWIRVCKSCKLDCIVYYSEFCTWDQIVYIQIRRLWRWHKSLSYQRFFADNQVLTGLIGKRVMFIKLSTF